MANTKTVEMHEEALTRLLRGQMIVKNVTADDVCRRMKLPMSTSSLYDKLRNPGKFRVCELWDVCSALGIDDETLKNVI